MDSKIKLEASRRKKSKRMTSQPEQVAKKAVKLTSVSRRQNKAKETPEQAIPKKIASNRASKRTESVPPTQEQLEKAAKVRKSSSTPSKTSRRLPQSKSSQPQRVSKNESQKLHKLAAQSRKVKAIVDGESTSSSKKVATTKKRTGKSSARLQNTSSARESKKSSSSGKNRVSNSGRRPQSDSSVKNPRRNLKRKKNNTGLIVTLSLISIVVIIALIVFMGGSKKPATEAPVVQKAEVKKDDIYVEGGMKRYSSLEAAPANANLYQHVSGGDYIDVNTVAPDMRTRFTKNKASFRKVSR